MIIYVFSSANTQLATLRFLFQIIILLVARNPKRKEKKKEKEREYCMCESVCVYFVFVLSTNMHIITFNIYNIHHQSYLKNFYTRHFNRSGERLLVRKTVRKKKTVELEKNEIATKTTVTIAIEATALQ